MAKEEGRGGGGVFDDLLGRLGELLGKLEEAGEKAATVSHTGGLGSADGDHKAVYGVSVRFGIGGEPVRAEPFGNVSRDADTGEAVVREVREPLVDVFEEEGQVLVVAETPGVASEDVRVELRDDVLSITADSDDRRYSKEVLLPRACDPDSLTVSCNNGILEIRLRNA